MLTTTIHDTVYTFQPVEAVQSELPADFTLADVITHRPPQRLFWQAADRLDTVRAKLLAAVPWQFTAEALPELADRLTAILRSELIAQSGSFAMTVDAVDMIVLDFRDLLMSGIYALIEQLVSPTEVQLEAPQFYVNKFLSDTSYWGSDTYPVNDAEGDQWVLQIAYNHFGPFGGRLTSDKNEQPLFLLDLSLSDPAGQPLQQLATAILGRLFEQKGDR
ncbi:MAG: hypothetical protein QNJ45_21440 [Ardenticatenaceae bacterium]|nr:hypothetical protein [Ardenticatenaceae bacterium]